MSKYEVRDIDQTVEIAALKAERDRLTIIADAIQAERDRLRAELDATAHLEKDLEDAMVERDDAVKVWRIMDACRQHAEEECNKLRAALEEIASTGTLTIEWAKAIARRALLEGK